MSLIVLLTTSVRSTAVNRSIVSGVSFDSYRKLNRIDRVFCVVMTKIMVISTIRSTRLLVRLVLIGVLVVCFSVRDMLVVGLLWMEMGSVFFEVVVVFMGLDTLARRFGSMFRGYLRYGMLEWVVLNWCVFAIGSRVDVFF